jgi:hypothetical protein
MESYLINRGDNSGAALENIDQGILSSQVPMEIPGINLYYKNIYITQVYILLNTKYDINAKLCVFVFPT